MQRIEFRAMGCQMAAMVDTCDAGVAKRLAQVPTWFEEWDRALSRFRPDSELSRLNRSQGGAVRVGQVLWQVLGQARAAARQSDGLVTPALLDHVEAAGYDQSFERLAPWMGPTEFATPPVRDWRAIELDSSAHTVRLPPAMRLDLGGIAKGWAADQAVARLSRYGPALVDAGGDIAISGPMEGGERWPVAVADPMAPERDIARLWLDREAVATSGRDYRCWPRDGKWQHHIIDPRTGRPAETDVLSATVIAPTATEAEMAAKVTLILGSAAGLAWIEAREQLAALLVLENGRVLRSRQMGDYEQDPSAGALYAV
ncbi:MAG: FAD:protein FMN transferase [Chloroflexi bacterium]|nr:FAD:protein FMN transferase [Chloroflexota bacterium]